MAGNERIRYAGKSSLLQMNVGAANFRNLDREQRRIAFKLRFGNLTHLDARVRRGNYSYK